jgi:hypothetical protein
MGNKSEARIARALERQLKQAGKSARLREVPENSIFARAKVAPVSNAEVRIGADPASIFDMTMTWTKDHADCEGSWKSGTARQWTDDCWEKIISPKLGHWEKLKWSEIDVMTTGGRERHKMHHNMPVEVLTSEAQLRLMHLEKEEHDIFRFRLGNKRRLWGFRVVANFEINWYDPEHEIYPTDPD